MLIMNRKRMVEDKLNRLISGQTAYAESRELIRLVKREIENRQISVLMDETDSGCWFIPQENTITPSDEQIAHM
ncbi:hypothetical protein N780_02215 [Pontibacillus chungwhensis BH030062]|uniref:Uncharacterized protein n=1 Tax=Pontibacillus chungwhensis BH030062 TaxID=1385513 RepID=A0A0A2UVR5_9BACI|nr:hypothetical protein [Pontibacillus chungwhensis]KGP90823.1 hypothetical protein N780_02215 [Pontibacillus chungwhensis BH030062]